VLVPLRALCRIAIHHKRSGATHKIKDAVLLERYAEFTSAISARGLLIAFNFVLLEPYARLEPTIVLWGYSKKNFLCPLRAPLENDLHSSARGLQAKNQSSFSKSTIMDFL
jgi:hypothetical protein